VITKKIKKPVAKLTILESSHPKIEFKNIKKFISLTLSGSKYKEINGKILPILTTSKTDPINRKMNSAISFFFCADEIWTKSAFNKYI
jgi:hypothetical protein